MAFEKVISVDVLHNYFDDAAVPGLYFKPTMECERMLRNYRLLLKNNNQFSILRNSDDAIPEFKPNAGLSFDFFIYTPDNTFFKYTGLAAKGADELYVYSNQADAAVLSQSVVPKAQFNHASHPNFLGVLQLYFSFSGARSLQLKFQTKKLKWKYYILSGTTLTEPVVEGSLCGITFKKQTVKQTAADAVSRKLSVGFPDALISVFESSEEIPLNNAGKKNIRLKNNSDSRIMISHLPNPGLNENGVKIINLLN
ncbi:hypothetical protein [Mucilaginibacter phyllosphaerae]|uniref:Uncharacterized protein n=1 Tax=Mucilaginibacter phyllosphaerae TaxID=1812349 RepID=A0A4Y8AC18_9SPHI|nr:hypothetical protein [Mucilaginibacter phyllosphaerae]MBB3969173.1 hypothetical protein [Mucilaginibacter phyllosphaerae]TEW66020.1 hypothetical protein E2R65_12910 [Mucilaginibacter phyllosphaerae]GGH06778.1 hypothetical protein GCM10007352_11160 [Mucilaginibacter phyllosphaerae]